MGKSEEKPSITSDSNSGKLVIITGVNSTLGKYLAQKFLSEGWQVIGTCRTKSLSTLEADNRLKIYELDLTSTESTTVFIDSVQNLDIDIMINNAGHVLSGPFEGSSNEQIKNQFDINFFGPLALIRGLLPNFRKRKKGIIVNVSSLCGLTTFPMLSLYHASKWALEGFSESLMYELEPLGITIKLIEPGGIKENQYSSHVEFSENIPSAYTSLVEKIHKTNWFPSFSHPQEVANLIYHAATDNKKQLRYIIGKDAEGFIEERKTGISDESCFDSIRTRIKLENNE